MVIVTGLAVYWPVLLNYCLRSLETGWITVEKVLEYTHSHFLRDFYSENRVDKSGIFWRYFSQWVNVMQKISIVVVICGTQCIIIGNETYFKQSMINQQEVVFSPQNEEETVEHPISSKMRYICQLQTGNLQWIINLPTFCGPKQKQCRKVNVCLVKYVIVKLGDLAMKNNGYQRRLLTGVQK